MIKKRRQAVGCSQGFSCLVLSDGGNLVHLNWGVGKTVEDLVLVEV
jgi:hypothetical protein